MAESVATGRTALSAEDVVVRAIPFFTGEKWRTQSHSTRVATFVGKTKVPWGLLFFTFLCFLAFVIPGVIMYLFVIRRMHRFQNLVVTANPITKGSEVVITYSKQAKKLVNRFLGQLPPISI